MENQIKSNNSTVFAVIPFKQEGVSMYVGVISADALIKHAQIDEWHENTGYQRKPEIPRTQKVAQYLKSHPRPLLPTSVLASVRDKQLEIAQQDGMTLAVISPDVKMWIVDGQHRTFGVAKAIQEFGLERLREYPLPIVIVEFPCYEDEADQFRVINETMKKVRTDLARRLLSLRLGTKSGRHSLKETRRLWEAVAVKITEVLNRDEDSPWQGRIQPPNQKKEKNHIIRELSFTTSLKPIVACLTFRNLDDLKLAGYVKEYWNAWREILPEAFENPGEYVLMKTPGVFSLHELAYFVMRSFHERNIPMTREYFTEPIRQLEEYAELKFWEAANMEGAAMAGSMKGFGILADTFYDKLQEMGFVLPERNN